MARLMSSGDTASKVFRPRAPFGIVAKATSGTISGDWRLEVSPDNSDWYDADTTNIRNGYQQVFQIPIGFYCRISGGTGSNLQIDGNYLAESGARFDLAEDVV